MKRTAALSLILLGAAITFLSSCNLLFYRYQSAECKARGKAYSARAEKLKQDAAETLKIGTKKDVVIRFFQENGIPPTFLENEITGTIYLKGCAPSGCGTDDALLGLRVEVDKEGTVTSKPSVGAIYTNCL